MNRIRWYVLIAIVLGLAAAVNAAATQKKYDPGAGDAVIKIGNSMPYGGPASSYATIGKAMAGFFDMINSEGGQLISHAD